MYTKLLIVFSLVIFVSMANPKETKKEEIFFVNTAIERISASLGKDKVKEKRKIEASPEVDKDKFEQIDKIKIEFKEMEELKKIWEDNPTKENFDALTAKITIIAFELGTKSNVTWKTRPNPGAIIYYQTKRARERGDKPESISNPTVSMQAIGIGRYYVWSQRGAKITSYRDRILTIVEENEEVTIMEDRNK